MRELSVTIWITTACNLVCSYCYEGKNKSNHSLPADKVPMLIDFIVKHTSEMKADKLLIRFHGGEPLLEIDIIQTIIQGLRSSIPSSCIHFSLTTNATIMDKSIIEFIVDNIDDVAVSIDGEQKTHDKQRRQMDGTGSYVTVVANSLRLLSKKPEVCARMTVTRESVHALYNNIKSLLSLGFHRIVCQPDSYDNKWDENDLRVFLAEGKKIAELITKTNTYKNINISLVNGAEKAIRIGLCMGGELSINITSNGDIYPCILSANNKTNCIGSIDKGIDSEKLKQIKLVNETANVHCEGCARYDYCEGARCKLINEVKTGSPYKPSPLTCHMENISIEINRYYQKLLNENHDSKIMIRT